MFAVVLLGVTVAVVLFAHRWIRPSLTVLTATVIGFAAGRLHLEESLHTLRHLANPLGFLAAAVPLAALLGHVGFFDAVADRLPSGPRLLPTLWVAAAVVTTIINLDAAIVLLTPLYIRLAHRFGLDPLRTAFIPVLLATLSSSALPVSNLTNLIVESRFDVGVTDFVSRLGAASAVAVAVGWWAFRRVEWTTSADGPLLRPGDGAIRSDPVRALRVGGPAVGVLLLGFTLGDLVGVPAWATAALVVAGLMAATRTVPWRQLPIDAIVIASGLALLAGAAAPRLGLGHLLGGEGVPSQLGTAAAGVAGAVAVNNIPALLLGLPFLDRHTVWPYLAGVNLGPSLWIYGSLAGLLWLDIVRNHGVVVTPKRYAAVGIRVGLPALAAAVPVVVLFGTFTSR